MAGAGRLRRRAGAARARWATRASHAAWPRSIRGFRRGRGGAPRFSATRPCSLGAGSWSEPVALGGLGAGGRADALIGVIQTGSGWGATLPPPAGRGRGTRPLAPAAVGEHEAVHAHPGSRPAPAREPPARAAAVVDEHDRGSPGFTIEVRLLGGEAGGRLAQQAGATAAVLAWFAADPPTPPCRGRVGGRRRRHAWRTGHDDASRDAASGGGQLNLDPPTRFPCGWIVGSVASPRVV
jgi:hypothetical protein